MKGANTTTEKKAWEMGTNTERVPTFCHHALLPGSQEADINYSAAHMDWASAKSLRDLGG